MCICVQLRSVTIIDWLFKTNSFVKCHWTIQRSSMPIPKRSTFNPDIYWILISRGGNPLNSFEIQKSSSQIWNSEANLQWMGFLIPYRFFECVSRVLEFQSCTQRRFSVNGTESINQQLPVCFTRNSEAGSRKRDENPLFLEFLGVSGSGIMWQQIELSLPQISSKRLTRRKTDRKHSFEEINLKTTW